MATKPKADVQHDARKAAGGYFTPTDEAFVGENRVRVWVEDPEQLTADLDQLAIDALEYYGYRSTNKTFRSEFERQFKLELRNFHNSLPDVRDQNAIEHVRWEVEYAITQAGSAAKNLAEKLAGDDPGHALEWSTGSVETIAKGDVAKIISKNLLAKIGGRAEDGTPFDFAWLAGCIVRASVREAARISHGSNEMNFTVEFYRMKAWGDFARNAQTQLHVMAAADAKADR